MYLLLYNLTLKGKKQLIDMPKSILYALMDRLKDIEKQQHYQDNES
jgi:hypothetical protein